MELAYRLWGTEKNHQNPQSKDLSPPAPPQTACKNILLLHGMGGTGALWRPIAASLEDEFQVLAPDQRGHGGSRPVPAIDADDFRPEAYGRDLVELLHSLGWSKTWVIGHSMGVRSAVALAHLAPSLVAGLVLVDLGLAGPAGGGLGQPLAEFLRDMPMQFPSREAARSYLQAQCPDASIAQYLMAVATAVTPPSTQTPAPLGSQPAALTFPFDREALLKTLAAAENSSVRDWIPAILDYPIPILALRGETSRVWGAEDYEKEKARFAASPSLTFEVFNGTGHGLPFEKRAQFIARVTQWIRAHS